MPLIWIEEQEAKHLQRELEEAFTCIDASMHWPTLGRIHKELKKANDFNDYMDKRAEDLKDG